jgi:hypothetical protein
MSQWQEMKDSKCRGLSDEAAKVVNLRTAGVRLSRLPRWNPELQIPTCHGRGYCPIEAF